MPRFEVTISEMYNAASKIHQAAEDYLAAACKVYAAAEALGASWEGDSQVAFMQEQQQAVEWYKKMAALVQSYVQMIQRAAKAYQEADQQATGSIKDGGGIGGGLSGVIGGVAHNWSQVMNPIVTTLYAAPNLVLGPSGGFSSTVL